MKLKTLLVVVMLVLPQPLYAQVHGEVEKATINVAQEVGKSVVSISSVVKQKVGLDRDFYFSSPFGENDPFRRFFEEFFGEFPEREFKRMGLGSGVIIDKDGYILTNEHVISGATEIKVKLYDGREFTATVKGKDRNSDLAIIKIDAENLSLAKLGDSDNLQIGAWVIAIGNPFGFAIDNPEPTVTVGVISALHRYVPALGMRERSYDDLIQTDAAINPGNSGGPLVNLNGEIIGINTAIITTSGGYQGLGFAIPINKAKKILSRLIKGEKILYGWLGISIQDLNNDLRSYFGIKENEGVIIVKVYKDSPGEKSGLKEGDLILEFANQRVRTKTDLVRLVSSSEVGRVFPLKVIRDGQEKTIEVKIGKRPEDITELEQFGEAESIEPESSVARFRGMEVENINQILKRRFRIQEQEGVVIVDIKEDSPAEKSGLMVGDVILKLKNTTIKNKTDFISVTSKIKGSILVKTGRGYFVLKE